MKNTKLSLLPRVDGSKGRLNNVSWHDRFIKALGAFPNVSLACGKVGISRDTAYAHRSKFPEFAGQWDEAIEGGIDNADAELYRRAVDGVQRPVYDRNGKQIGVETEYSDRCLIFLLAGRRRAVYGNKLEIDNKPDRMSPEESEKQHKMAKEGIIATYRASLGLEAARAD